MKDIKLYMSENEYEAYQRGESAYGIKADSWWSLIKKLGTEMWDLRYLVKVKSSEIVKPLTEIFGKKVIEGWYEVIKTNS
jgi:hypothetical protein